jgi:hypothetical protein
MSREAAPLDTSPAAIGARLAAAVEELQLHARRRRQWIAISVLAVLAFGGYRALLHWGYTDVQLAHARSEGWVAFRAITVCHFLPKNFESIVLARDEADESTWVRIGEGGHFASVGFTWVDPRHLRVFVSRVPQRAMQRVDDVTIEWKTP